MLSNETVGLSEVAAALGRSEGWVKRNWLRFYESHGFPRKIPSGWVWPRGAVVAWLRSGGLVPPAAQTLIANDNAGDPVAAAAASLRERYGARP